MAHIFLSPISIRYSLSKRAMMGPVEAHGNISYVKDITKTSKSPQNDIKTRTDEINIKHCQVTIQFCIPLNGSP